MESVILATTSTSSGTPEQNLRRTEDYGAALAALATFTTRIVELHEWHGGGREGLAAMAALAAAASLADKGKRKGTVCRIDVIDVIDVSDRWQDSATGNDCQALPVVESLMRTATSPRNSGRQASRVQGC